MLSSTIMLLSVVMQYVWFNSALALNCVWKHLSIHQDSGQANIGKCTTSIVVPAKL